ncbi:hypothetical protein BJV78DRAFT_1195724 [Lactifluus subvellereus]|nr:hypothetical protein BJV78DRAFT_1195724 [Lactifluus subvellereus]
MAIGKAAKWISFATTQHAPTSSSAVQDCLHSTVSIADEKQFGLENFGNTCYANSVLQALYFCSPFRDLVIQSTDISAPPLPAVVSRPTHPPQLQVTPVAPRRKSERGKPVTTDVPSAPTSPTLIIPSTPPTLFSALRSLYVYISRNPADKGALAPRAFIDKLRDGNELFRGAMHQDAHEFLNYLLNKIVEEIQYDKHHKDKNAGSSNDSGEDLPSSLPTLVSNNVHTPNAQTDSFPQSGTLVHRLFEGTLTSETRCLTCETVSSRDESFLDLSIDIEQNSSVTACLRQFSASEMLCQRNKFFCDSCCGLQEAEKRMKIKKLPNILALHLKRFKYQEDLKKYIKLTYRVAFPLELRLFNTVDDVDDPDRLYELFGIVVHIGSGPHHGHYVAIVKGPHSWLVFDDDKIEPIKESEIPRYFGDAASGSAYVLYYQAVDLDPMSLGIKPPAPPTAPDVAVAGTCANAASVATNGVSLSEPPEPALPPGLGESAAPAPIPAAAPAPHPPILTAPSSPSLPSSPLVASATPPTRKKSLPSLRISGTSEPSSTSPTTPNRGHGGLFQSLRSSQSSSRIRRPSTSEGFTSPRSPAANIPPVPLVPLQFINGKEHTKEKEKERDKSVEREREREREKDREEGRSSKEFDRKATLWFKRRSFKPKDEREKEKEKDAKGKDRDVGAAPVPSMPPSQPTTSAAVLSTTPSQSDAASSVSGTTSLWRRSSARLGYHAKRLSATYSSTTLGEPDLAVAVGSPPGPSSMAPHPQHHQPSQPLSAVPATPQSPRPPSTPTTSASDSPTLPPALAPHRPPPLAGTDDGLLLPLARGADTEVDVGAPGSAPLPAWRISPPFPSYPPSRQDPTTSMVSHHASELSSVTNGNDDPLDEHRYQHLFSNLLPGRRRGRPHSVHGSGSNTPRDRSTSSNGARLPQTASALESGSTTVLSGSLANGASSSSSSSASAAHGKEREKEKEPGKFRRGPRKLSLHMPMFSLGLGFGLGGREKERDHSGKREDSKKVHKVHPPDADAGAAAASAAR